MSVEVLPKQPEVSEQTTLPLSYEHNEGWHQYSYLDDGTQQLTVNYTTKDGRTGVIAMAGNINRLQDAATGIDIAHNAADGVKFVTVSLPDAFAGTVEVRRQDGAASAWSLNMEGATVSQHAETQQSQVSQAAESKPETPIVRDGERSFLLPKDDGAPLFLHYEKANGGGRLTDWLRIDPKAQRTWMETFVAETVVRDGKTYQRLTVDPSFRGVMTLWQNGVQHLLDVDTGSVVLSGEQAPVAATAETKVEKQEEREKSLPELLLETQAQITELNENRAALRQSLARLSETEDPQARRYAAQLQTKLTGINAKVDLLLPVAAKLQQTVREMAAAEVIQ